MSDITATTAWSSLEKLHTEKTSSTLRDLFRADAERTKRYSFEAAGLHVDLSKNLVDDDVVTQLLKLAQEANLRAHIDAMFDGAHINTTEDRAVLHTALRMPTDRELSVDGQDVAADVHAVLAKLSLIHI